MPNPSTAMFTIRPAVRGDKDLIRAMVRSQRLNPFGLDWRNFLVAEDAGRRIVGIGAVKTHGDSSRELASIAVAPGSRGQGIADAVIRTILERERTAAGGLYLTCRDEMTAFYGRFGFRTIGAREMPPYFRRLHRFVSIASGIFRMRNRMRIMKREPDPPGNP